MTPTNLTQEQKDRISMLLKKEISEVETVRYTNQMILDINIKGKPSSYLDDEQKEEKRQSMLNTYQKIVDFYTKDLQQLEDIQKKLINE